MDKLEMILSKITLMEDRQTIADKKPEYQKALRKYSKSKDIEKMEKFQNIMEEYEQQVEYIMDTLGSKLMFNSHMYFVYTYLSLAHIPIYKRILRIAAIYSDIKAVEFNGEILTGDFADINDDDYSLTELTTIPVVNYENVMDAVETYNKLFYKELTVEDIFKNKEEMIKSAFKDNTKLIMHNSQFDRSIKEYMTGLTSIYIKENYLIDSYVFKSDLKSTDDL